jgi:hypothetical protein
MKMIDFDSNLLYIIAMIWIQQIPRRLAMNNLYKDIKQIIIY